MKNSLLALLLIIVVSVNLNAQIDANSLFVLPTATTIAEMNGIASPNVGSMLYNLEDLSVYRYDGSIWVKNTDDQNASEVPLVTNVDVNGTTSDPTPVLETNVEEIVQAIAPITSKAARVFYPPSIAIDASTIGTGRTVDLYDEYTTQFGSPTAASTGAPAAVPTYTRTELYYYVTLADPAVFANISIDANGVMTYDIIATPADYNSLINVVFMVK